MTIKEIARRHSLQYKDPGLNMCMNSDAFVQAQRVCALLASSGDMVPKHFQGKPAAVFVALEFAVRTGISPMMALQNIYMVHGRPALESKLMVGLLQASGEWGPIKYEIKRDRNQIVSCKATVKHLASGEWIEGPAVTADLVKRYGWDKPKGATKRESIWKTDPELMFQYRAAARLIRVAAPGALMGLSTATANDAGQIIDAEIVPEEKAKKSVKVEKAEEDVPHFSSKPEPEAYQANNNDITSNSDTTTRNIYTDLTLTAKDAGFDTPADLRQFAEPVIGKYDELTELEPEQIKKLKSELEAMKDATDGR